MLGNKKIQCMLAKTLLRHLNGDTLDNVFFLKKY